MAHLYKTFWIYRDGIPVKRFVGDKQNEAYQYALDLRVQYPSSLIRCRLQKMQEEEVFVFEPIREAIAKETNDA